MVRKSTFSLKTNIRRFLLLYRPWSRNSLLGPAWETNPEAKAFTLKKSWRREELIPIHGVTNMAIISAFMRLKWKFDRPFLQARYWKFGLVPYYREEYYTNSFHYDVRKIIAIWKVTSRKIISVFFQVVSSITANTQCFVKIQLEAVWILPMTKSDEHAIDHCYKCGFDGEFTQRLKGSNVHNARTIIANVWCGETNL